MGTAELSDSSCSYDSTGGKGNTHKIKSERRKRRERGREENGDIQHLSLTNLLVLSVSGHGNKQPPEKLPRKMMHAHS